MFRLLVIGTGCLVLAAPVHGQTVLTLEQTIARAREQAGAVAVARARVAEAEATLVDASARFRDNPVFEAAAGPRAGSGRRATDVEAGVSQQFETGGQRAARIAGARAAIDRQVAEVRQVARGVVFEAAAAFLDGVAALERLQIGEAADTVSREVLAVTERRYAVGDIAAIELNLARIDAARASATLLAARGDLTAAVGALRALLRLPSVEPIELRGSLDVAPAAPLSQLEQAVEQRPEFEVLAADERDADAQVRLGRALRSPDLGFRVGYEREEADTVILGGFTVTLPAFQAGRGTEALGLARASRLRIEREMARDAAVSELRAAYAVYEQRAAAAAAFQRDAAPPLLDNEALGRRSYEAGEMNLMDYLLVRRDVLETRAAVIDRRLEAARSRLTVDYVAGVLQ